MPCVGGLRQDQTTSATPNLLAAHRTVLPDDPVEHAHGKVGNSNRWWYLPGMYKPVSRCAHCARVRVEAPAAKKVSHNGRLFLQRMARAAAKAAARAAAKAVAKAGCKRRRVTRAPRAEPVAAPKPIEKTAEAYKVPIVLPAGQPVPEQCCTWPRYDGVGYVLGHNVAGESLLDLSVDCLLYTSPSPRDS